MVVVPGAGKPSTSLPDTVHVIVCAPGAAPIEADTWNEIAAPAEKRFVRIPKQQRMEVPVIDFTKEAIAHRWLRSRSEQPV